MPKTIAFNKIKGLTMILKFGEEAKYVIDGVANYYSALARITGTAKAYDNGQEINSALKIDIDKTIPIGAKQTEPSTPNQIYDFIKTKLGQSVADKLKELYIEGINEDISQ